MLKLMYAALVGGADRWRGIITITEFERRLAMFLAHCRWCYAATLAAFRGKLSA